MVGPSAIVLGSTQKIDDVDALAAARHEIDVVRRGSGGGAVLVMPDAQVWLDVWVPRTDPLWDDDVIESSWWLGEAWVRGLETLGATGLLCASRTRHAHRLVRCGVLRRCRPRRGDEPGTAKVVGMAQRRTRDGARLHSMALVSWSPACVARAVVARGAAP